MSHLQDNPICLAVLASTTRVDKRESQGIYTPISVILGTAVLAFSVNAQAAPRCEVGGKAAADQSVTVTLSEHSYYYSVCGGYSYSDDEVSRNTVTVQGGEVGTVYGGYAIAGGNASNNTVNIEAGTVSNFVYGGYSKGSSANNNTVIIEEGVASTIVYGGYSEKSGADNNTVIILGGTVTNAIYGADSFGGSASNNRVVLKGTPSIASAPNIYGGQSNSPEAIVRGNVLEIWTRGVNAGQVQGFDEYHFLLPANTVAGDIILSAEYGIDVVYSRIGVAIQGGSSSLAVGDSIVLIHTPGRLMAPTDMQPLNGNQMQDHRGDSYLQQGVSLGYQFSLSADDQNLYAVLKSAPRVLDQSKAPVEGIMSGVALTQNAGDLAASSGTSNAVAAVQGASGVASFGATSGGSSRYKTGSHVDVKDWNLLLGMAKRFEHRMGALTAGAFVEAGWGRYNSYNAFGGFSVRGDGHSRYVGVGVLARQNWESGAYVEGSLRGGRVHADWSSNQMVGADHASYDISTPYFGAHAGVGKVTQLSPQLSLDTSAKYFWTHQNSSDAVIANDSYHFAAVDSHSTRLGVRATYAYTDQFAVYTGAAWNYEFDGAAHATIYGMRTAAPSLKGSSGIFELGVRLQPQTEKSALTLDMGLQGYTGKREGVSGTLKAGWAF